MSSFSRIAMVAFFMLSLSFLVSARPTESKELQAREVSVEALAGLIARLLVDVQVQIKVILAASVIADVKVAIAALVVLIKACVAAIIDLGVIADIDISVKLDICAKVALIITVIVQACIQLVVKFGLTVVIGLCVELQACIQLLVVKLDVCIGAVIAVVLEAIVDVNVRIFITLHLQVVANVLGLISL